jgi:NodT family efflux transporter outer membrane factor (OMF) lipoprotein
MPAVSIPQAFAEVEGWKPADPADVVRRTAWWEVYRDSTLDALVAQVQVSDQNVLAAEAQYREAVALLRGAHAALFPQVSAAASTSTGGTGSALSGGSTAAAVATSPRIEATATWEADVWGRLRGAVAVNAAAASASAADLRSALLSDQATLVEAYLQIRIDDARKRLLEQTTAAYERALEITTNRYQAGVVSRLDVTQADALLKTARAQAIDLGVERDQLEHAVALLVGKLPEGFHVEAVENLPDLPDVPLGLPSALLERRPDVAAAERRVAAANAQVGVARAAWFPTLTLSADGGAQATNLAHLLSLPTRFWSIGPELAVALLDGGARSAQKAQAAAAYDRTVATYRQTVLTGFEEVEDTLAALRILENEATVQREAAQAAADSVALANNQYLAGTVSYLNVTQAQQLSLTAEEASLDITNRRLQASVALLKALGDGWSAQSFPMPAQQVVASR